MTFRYSVHSWGSTVPPLMQLVWLVGGVQVLHLVGIDCSEYVLLVIFCGCVQEPWPFLETSLQLVSTDEVASAIHRTLKTSTGHSC